VPEGACRRRPDLRVLILSMHDNEQFFFEALQVGASDYVLKSAADRDLAEACRAACTAAVQLSAGGQVDRPRLSRTVERHRANILSKLGMRDRVELTRYAIRRGLVEA